MSWRDELQPASYRGVPFEAIDLSGEAGRRVVVTESPETDDIGTDDVGARAATFKLRAFVSGPDYLDQRDALYAACMRAGVGELVHPWRGRMKVRCQKVSYEHDSGGGACSIDMEFVEAGGGTAPVVTTSATKATRSAATTISAAAAAATDTLATDTKADNPIFGVTVFVSLLEEEVADLSEILGTLSTGVSLVDLVDVATSSTVGTDIATAIDLCDDLARLVAYVVRTSPHVLVLTTDSPRAAAAEDARAEAWAGIRVCCAARACALAVAASYVSADDAEAALAVVGSALSDLLLDVEAVDLYTSLVDLRTWVTDALIGAADRLPREYTIDIGVPTPSLTIAAAAYETTTLAELEVREAELISLNNVAHPGFMVGPTKALAR